MATIINTLEVVVEPPRGPAPASGAATPVSPAPTAPNDLSDVLERQARYAARLRAH